MIGIVSTYGQVYWVRVPKSVVGGPRGLIETYFKEHGPSSSIMFHFHFFFKALVFQMAGGSLVAGSYDGEISQGTNT